MGVMLKALVSNGVKFGKGLFRVAERNPKMVVGGSLAYLGWDTMFGKNGVKDQIKENGVAGVVSNVAIGENRANYVRGKVDNITGYKKEDQTSSGENMEANRDANNTYDSSPTAEGQVDGVQSFLGNTFNGNGTGMFGNFISNLFSGRVSGMSIAGLLAGAWLMFSRFGIWGKIGGALLAMLMIGNNSEQQTITPQRQMDNGQNLGMGNEVEQRGYGRGM